MPLAPEYVDHLGSVEPFLRELVAQAQARTLEVGRYEVTLAGDPQMRLDTSAATTSDFHKLDLVSVPLALAALAIYLRSLRLLLLPLLTIPAAAAIALATLKLAALAHLNVNFVVPAVLVCVVVAVSIDYTLFLLSAFEAARRSGASRDDAVLAALREAGHTVIASGAPLASHPPRPHCAAGRRLALAARAGGAASRPHCSPRARSMSTLRRGRHSAASGAT